MCQPHRHVRDAGVTGNAGDVSFPVTPPSIGRSRTVDHAQQRPGNFGSTAEAVRPCVGNSLLTSRGQFFQWIVLADWSEQFPFAGNALQDVSAAILESDSRAVDEVLNRAGRQDFAGAGLGSDSRSDVDCDSTDVVASSFAFAGM